MKHSPLARLRPPAVFPSMHGGCRPEAPSNSMRCSDEATAHAQSPLAPRSARRSSRCRRRGARGAGMRLGEWVREALLSAPMDAGPDSGEVALAAEVLQALRSLLLNMALPFGQGGIPVAEMRGLIEQGRRVEAERGAGAGAAGGGSRSVQGDRPRGRRRQQRARQKPNRRRSDMAEWGRKEYAKKWPSRTPVWTWTAVLGVAGVLRGDADAGVRGCVAARISGGLWRTSKRRLLDYSSSRPAVLCPI